MRCFQMCSYCFWIVVLVSLRCCCGTGHVSLKVAPGINLFEGSFFVLKCVPEERAADWTVHRNATARPVPQRCGQGWGKQLSNSCKVGLAVTWDSGLYWCQSTEGAISSTVGVRVARGKLLVVVPFFPVSEGEDVTLSCLNRSRSIVSAHFYKDDLQVTSDPRSDLRLRAVSWSERGSYKCSTGAMESSPVLLQVHNRSWTETEVPPTSSTSDSAHMHMVSRLLCLLLVFCPYCISTGLMVSLCRQQRLNGKH
ncbi:hypothetical protein NQD34_013447 [Periophthalmus magnuspinnatus]|nr:hypothetical protein NQD34_013447 [Periophthalmus magnuspinnatus]